jgi:hypothetical protein
MTEASSTVDTSLPYSGASKSSHLNARASFRELTLGFGAEHA